MDHFFYMKKWYASVLFKNWTLLSNDVIIKEIFNELALGMLGCVILSLCLISDIRILSTSYSSLFPFAVLFLGINGRVWKVMNIISGYLYLTRGKMACLPSSTLDPNYHLSILVVGWWLIDWAVRWSAKYTFLWGMS